MGQNLLAYVARPGVILKYLGHLGMALGVIVSVPMIASLFFGEWNFFLYYLAISAASLILGYRFSKITTADSIQHNEVITVICLSFFGGSLIAALPLMADGFSFANALFEAISGITTTGLTMVTRWDSLSATTYFTRAWLQWTGGLGILIFSLALLPRHGIIVKMPESLQSDNEDPIGGSRHHAQVILYVYCFFTILGIFGMLFMGSGLYDAVLLVLASVSTGGFSPYPESIANISRMQQIGLLGLAFLCAISLPFYYKLWNHRVLLTQQSIQAIGMVVFCSLVSLALGWTIDSWIVGVSAQTTTGFSSIDISPLADSKKLILSISMLIGGGVGSTAGGFKILRLLLFFIALRTLIMRINQTSHAVYTPKFLGIPFSDKQFEQAATLISLYFFVTGISWLCFVGMGYPAVDSLFEVASAIGTVGLSTGITSPDLPVFLKGVLSVDMLLGRLEIFPWLVVFYPGTWFGQYLEEK